METLDFHVIVMLYLISCSLRKEKPDEMKFEGINLNELYDISKKQSLNAAVYYSLSKTEFFKKSDVLIREKWQESYNKAIRKNILLDIERNEILNEFEKNQIWYMPLKGVIIKDLYPNTGIRQMADNDILFDGKYRTTVKKLMINRKYDVISYGEGVHDVYEKSPIYNYEMHIAPFDERYNKNWYEYYKDIKNRLVLKSGKKYMYNFTDEDFYIYIIAHAFKHFDNKGIGYRFLMDIFVFITNKNLNWNYISKELKYLKIDNFEEHTRLLSFKIFKEINFDFYKNLSTEEIKMLNGFSKAGTYGNSLILMENNLKKLQDNNSSNIKRKTKIRYCVRRVFPGILWCKNNYPFFGKHPYFIPFLWIYRGFKMLINRKRILNEISNLYKSK